MARDLVVGVMVYVYPGGTCLVRHQWILGEKYPGTVPYAVSRLDAEHAAAVACEADPLGTLNSLFAVRWSMMWSLKKSKLSLVHFCLSVSCGSLLHVCDLSEECALALKPSLAGIFVHVVLLTKLIPHSLPL